MREPLQAHDLDEDALVEDVSALGGLASLAALSIAGTRVTDARPLAALAGLVTFRATGAPLGATLSALGQLDYLQSVEIARTGVADLGFLRDHRGLALVDVADDPVTDLSPLAGDRAIARLDASGTRVRDVRALASLHALSELSLARTEVSDVSPLAGLVALSRLDLSHTRVTQAQKLSGLYGLFALSLAGTQVADVEPLRGSTGLYLLSLEGTRVTRVRPLSRRCGGARPARPPRDARRRCSLARPRRATDRRTVTGPRRAERRPRACVLPFLRPRRGRQGGLRNQVCSAPRRASNLRAPLSWPSRPPR